MANARTYRAGIYYFDADENPVGRELLEDEIKTLSCGQLLTFNSLLHMLLILSAPMVGL
jgi:hypothetical protein